jgi:hypothetical protein
MVIDFEFSAEDVMKWLPELTLTKYCAPVSGHIAVRARFSRPAVMSLAMMDFLAKAAPPRRGVPISN